MTTPMDRDAFGRILEDVLRDLPGKAAPSLRNVGFLIEERSPANPAHEAVWTPTSHSGLQQLAQDWTMVPSQASTMPVATVTLFMEPILAAGPDTAAEIRRVILRTLEAKEGLDPGMLEPRPPAAEPWEQDEGPDEEDGPPSPEEPAEMLVELAEAEIEALPAEARDWFDDVEIVAVDRPEAEGDPRRVADLPESEDELRVLVLYTQNIRRRRESAGTVIREILRSALAARGGRH